MLVRVGGTPYPPQGMEERLHEIDSRLGLHWQAATGNWAIIYKWADNDPRMARVRAGKLNPTQAFDLLTVLPKDCSPDQAYGYIVRTFKAWSGSREDVHKLLDRVHLYNKKRREDILREATDLAEELIKTNAPTLFSAIGKSSTRVYMTDKKLKKSKPLILADD